jgi:dTDP-4-dehydrorhamnose 3,5-epimerase
VIFIETKLKGAFIVEPEPHEDSRGAFARTFCAREFAARGLLAQFVQCSVSSSRKRGTLRGLHYQLPPACEVKLVRCTAGALYDVIVDLRPGSPTYRQHIGAELTARNRWALYVPEMFAHGFQTLEENTDVFYQISQYYAPQTATGVRFDDPRLAVQWPLPVAALSEKDMNWPLLG